MDILTPEERSERMRRVRQRHTAPEVAVRRVAHALGYRFRLHRRDLPGHPDPVFPRLRLAVFVHGCFWHGHPGCRASRRPRSNADYWEAKLAENQERDARVEASLLEAGWRVETVWECETRDPLRLKARLLEVLGLDATREALEHHRSRAMEHSPKK